jgi:hypothetical protein
VYQEMHSMKYKTTANLMLMFSLETFITAKYNRTNEKLIQILLKCLRQRSTQRNRTTINYIFRTIMTNKVKDIQKQETVARISGKDE